MHPTLKFKKFGKERNGYHTIQGSLIHMGQPRGRFLGNLWRSQDIFGRVFDLSLMAFEPNEYMLFYECTSFGFENMWIYSRNRYLSFETREKLTKMMVDLEVDMRGVIITDQANCP